MRQEDLENVVAARKIEDIRGKGRQCVAEQRRRKLAAKLLKNTHSCQTLDSLASHIMMMIKNCGLVGH